MLQAYVAGGTAAVRVRLTDAKAWLTVKGVNPGMARPEFEYRVPRQDAEAMAALPDVPSLRKTRHIERPVDQQFTKPEQLGAALFPGLLLASLMTSGAVAVVLALVSALALAPALLRAHRRMRDPFFEVDVFQGPLAGLVIAEVELKHELQAFTPPSWLGREITGDKRYSNESLAKFGLPSDHKNP